jgi:hypothetical protein
MYIVLIKYDNLTRRIPYHHIGATTTVDQKILEFRQVMTLR